MPSLYSRSKFLPKALNLHAKTDIKFSQNICTDFSVETKLVLQLVPVTFNLQYFNIFCNFKVFLRTLKEKLSSPIVRNFEIGKFCVSLIWIVGFSLEIGFRKLSTFSAFSKFYYNFHLP